MNENNANMPQPVEQSPQAVPVDVQTPANNWQAAPVVQPVTGEQPAAGISAAQSVGVFRLSTAVCHPDRGLHFADRVQLQKQQHQSAQFCPFLLVFADHSGGDRDSRAGVGSDFRRGCRGYHSSGLLILLCFVHPPADSAGGFFCINHSERHILTPGGDVYGIKRQ